MCGECHDGHDAAVMVLTPGSSQWISVSMCPRMDRSRL